MKYILILLFLIINYKGISQSHAINEKGQIASFSFPNDTTIIINKVVYKFYRDKLISKPERQIGDIWFKNKWVRLEIILEVERVKVFQLNKKREEFIF